MLLRIFTPITILLLVCLASFLIDPYNYAHTGRNPFFATIIFIPGLILLIPIDLFFRLIFKNRWQKVWLNELIVLALIGVLLLLFVLIRWSIL